MAFTAVDLFCGAGGLSAGLSKAGFRIVGAVDSWNVAVKTYRLNFDHPVICADAAHLSISELLRRFELTNDPDLVAGGPPCQGFSVQRIGEDQDDRNDLIFEFALFVLGLRPRMFLMENVPGLLGKRGSTIASRFEEAMRDGGYAVRLARINAAEYGVPQMRRRVFFYGWRIDSTTPFAFPPPTHAPEAFRTVWDAIGDLPSPPTDHSPYPGDSLHRRTRLAPINELRLRHIPPGGGFENLPVELRANCHRNGADAIGHRYVYGRLAPDRPASTITARFDSFTRGKFAHPYEDRNITLREGARLQTFDDSFRFAGTQEEVAALIGNAVPPLLAEVIGRSLIRHLSKWPQSRFEADTESFTPHQQLALFSGKVGAGG